MKLLKLLSFLGFFVSSLATTAQTLKEEPVSNSNASLKENALKAKIRKNEVAQAQRNKVAATSKPIEKGPIDENDIYMGRKAEFLGNLTVSELPSDFPTYDKSYGLRYYNNLVDNFYGSHKSILNDKVKQKIEQHYPSANNQKEINTK